MYLLHILKGGSKFIVIKLLSHWDILGGFCRNNYFQIIKLLNCRFFHHFVACWCNRHLLAFNDFLFYFCITMPWDFSHNNGASWDWMSGVGFFLVIFKSSLQCESLKKKTKNKKLFTRHVAFEDISFNVLFI